MNNNFFSSLNSSTKSSKNNDDLSEIIKKIIELQSLITRIEKRYKDNLENLDKKSSELFATMIKDNREVVNKLIAVLTMKIDDNNDNKIINIMRM